MKDFDIRLAISADLQSLYELERKTFSVDWISLRSWRRMLHSPSAAVIVATSDKKIVGSVVILFRNNSSVSRIYSVAVSNDFRHCGIGRALITHACLIAHKKNHREVRLESRMDNSNAHRLFRSLGFSCWGKPVEGYYADGAAACRFRFRLPVSPPVLNGDHKAIHHFPRGSQGSDSGSNFIQSHAPLI